MTEQNSSPQPQPQPQPEPQPQPQPQPEPQPQPQPQPEPGNAYEGIIQQQQEQINALLAHNKSLNEQIVSMVNNGAQFNQQLQPQPQPQPQRYTQPSLSDNADYSLESLAKEIGRKNV